MACVTTAKLLGYKWEKLVVFKLSGHEDVLMMFCAKIRALNKVDASIC